MFTDEITLTFSAGKGGDGIISWRREKYIPKGGPYGGDGGNGGDIILRATSHENTLSKYRHKKIIKAENGERGGTQVMHGASAQPLIVEVPIGTIVTDKETGEILCDLTHAGEEHILCRGGKGGFGNAHFPSSTRQAPHFAELGDIGETHEVRMELKLVADIGIIGLPNAGKSTLIQVLTNVQPKIANYPFTTLVPHLGVMEWKDQTLIIEDVPGLIEGASNGKGLGIQFLKHIERCAAIIHLLDASESAENIVAQYRTIRHELELWQEKTNTNTAAISEKPEYIFFSKIDICDAKELTEKQKFFEKEIKKTVQMTISAAANINISACKDFLIAEKQQFTLPIPEDIPTNSNIKKYDLRNASDPKHYTITREEDGNFRITGERIETIVRMTDTRYPDAVNRVYDVLGKIGALQKIKTLFQESLTQTSGFFEGEDDYVLPNILIADKSFPLEGILFMKQ